MAKRDVARCATVPVDSLKLRAGERREACEGEIAIIVPVDSLKLRALAVEADVDVRTMQRALARKPVRGRAGERCRDVLARHGFMSRKANVVEQSGAA
jgi:hypothetical protein